MFVGSRARPVLTADCESGQCGILNISEAYRPVTGIALLYGDGVCFL
jgi:hypothetical protein